MKNVIAIVLLYVIFFHAIWCTRVIASEGPGSPEAAQFEPIDTTDMVNLYTGNFNYTAPLMEISGPEGGWPVNLIYHAGVGPNTEASWVGLGWNLNPGAINRFVTGYPDDYWGGHVKSHFWAEKQKGYGVSVGVGFGPVGLNLNYDSYTGQMGVNASVSLLNAVEAVTGAHGLGKIANLANNIHFGADATFRVGTSGVGLSTDIGLRVFGESNIGISLGISAGLHSRDGASLGGGANIFAYRSAGQRTTSMSLMGVGFSSQNQGGNFSVAGTGFQSQSRSDGQGNLSSSGFSLSIPIGFLVGIPGLSVGLGYYEWEWWLDELYHERGFGSLHQLGYKQNSETDPYTLDYIWNNPGYNIIDDYLLYADTGLSSSGAAQAEDGFPNTKMERNLVAGNLNDPKYIYSATDIYQASAQGISGLFKPHFLHNYKMYDESSTETGKFEVLNNSENKGENIVFRFLNDTGFNFYSIPVTVPPNEVSFNGVSKKIEPAIDLETGSILGFRITADDGKIYEFFQPVFNYYQFSISYKEGASDPSQTSEQTQTSPYATSWLLTAIKGPDFYDVSGNGYSADDWGFWIKFQYTDSGTFVPWRTPHEGYAPSPNEEDDETVNWGIKDKFYLESIETATHIAHFVTSPRQDNQPPTIERVELSPHKWDSMSKWQPGNFIQMKLFFPFDKSRLNGLDLTNVKFTCFYKPYDATAEFTLTKTVDLNEARYSDATDGDSRYEIILDIGSGPGQVLQSCVMEITEPTQGTGLNFAASSVQLDEITLHQKVLLADGSYKTDYTTSFNSEIIEGVSFDLDYVLQNLVSNSNTNKKLTLNGVEKFGKNRVVSLPQTTFEYGYNPNWNQDSWDIWNGYTSIGAATEHMNSQRKSIADRDAGAWNLTKIHTPLGSTITIEYESDLINKVGGLQDSELSLFTPWFYTEYGVLQPDNVDYLYINDVTLQSNAEDFRQIFDEYPESTMPATVSYYTGVGTYNEVGSQNAVNVQNIETDVSVGTVGGGTANTYKISFDGQLNFDVSSSDRCYGFSGNDPYTDVPLNFFCSTNPFPYLFAISPNFLFGGGHRVKSIQISDGADTKKTEYRYSNGVLTTMPGLAFSSMDWLVTLGLFDNSAFRHEDALINFKQNILGPSPHVGYETIEAYEVDGQNDVLNGKTVYTFNTADDGQLSRYWNGISGRWEISDKTGIQGRMKSIATFGQYPGTNGSSTGDFFLVKQQTFDYRFSGDIVGDDRILLNSNQIYNSNSSSYPKLGRSNQYYTSQTEDDTNPIKYRHEVDNVFLTGVETTTRFFDQSNNFINEIKVRNDNIAFDLQTGQVLVSKTFGSNNEKYISESTPAHWQYPAMASQNMLSQRAGSKTYIIPSTESNAYATLRLNSNLYQYLNSASVTTWKDWGSNAWRQNDNYVAAKIGNNFVDFVDWVNFDDEESNPEIGDLVGNGTWKRTSNITKYDKYGHPTEERSIGGTYTTSRYGYGNEGTPDGALPIALATNARFDEIVYDDYEDNGNLTGNARTGEKALLISGTTTIGFTPNTAPVNGGNYTIALWVEPSPGDIVTLSVSGHGSAISSGFEWQLLTLKNIPANQQITVSTVGGVADDLRIYPDNATMSTFTYDPLTWQLTSITGKNNLTTFYEYDELGRLTLVRDNDQNILTKHAYNYATQ